MTEQLLWTIGSPDGRSPDLVDTYKDPAMLGDVVWEVPRDGPAAPQRWPLFHPSEADPDGGYRLHPYTVRFFLEEVPRDAHLLRVHYLTIAPRLAHLEVVVNGAAAAAYLRPEPSQSGEIRLLSGLHTTIYSEGIAEVVVPPSLLRAGENRLVLISRDGGETIRVDGIEAIRRLDRMASGAGLVYQAISFLRLAGEALPDVRRLEIAPSVLYRRDERGALAERCDLYLELGGGLAATALTLALSEGHRRERIDIPLAGARFGHLRATFELFDGDSPVEYDVRGVVNGAAFSRCGTVVRRRKWKVFVTPHAHTDIGYTHRQWEVAERLCRNVDAALDLLDDERRSADGGPQTSDLRPQGSLHFAYHLDSSWALETYLATRGPERRRRLFEQIRAGKIGVPSNYVDLLTQYAALEDLIRNSEFSEAVLRPEGLRSDFAAVVDVASLSGALPSVLAGAGVKYLVHANNQDRGPFRLNGGIHRRSPFFWEGAGGGRVLVWLAKMYCELRKVCGSPPVASAAERGLDLWLDEYEGEHYAPDAVLLYGQEADNTDLDPQPADFVRRWNETYAYPRLIACDVSEFFRYVEGRYGERLATVRGDGGAYWEDGVGSTIVPAIWVRQAQAALPAAERLEALAAIHNPDWSFPRQQYDEAWRSVLLWDEHTWGAFLSCRDPEALLQRDQWAAKEHMARESAAWAARLLHAAATRHSLSWNNDGREVVVYNPHSWPCGGAITVEIGRRERVVDPQSGAEVPARRLRTLDTQAIVELWIDNIEGLSYRRFVLREEEGGEVWRGGAPPKNPPIHATQPDSVLAGASAGAPQPAPGTGAATLENEHYRVDIDLGRGCAVSWFDKGLGRELVDAGDEWGFGQLLYARGGEGTRLVSNQADWPDGNPEVCDDFALIDQGLERFDHGTSLRLHGRVPCGVLEVEWTLPDWASWVDVRYVWRKEERLAKEAAYIAFPLALPGAAVRSDSQLGWVNWDRDQLPGDARSGCRCRPACSPPPQARTSSSPRRTSRSSASGTWCVGAGRGSWRSPAAGSSRTC